MLLSICTGRRSLSIAFGVDRERARDVATALSDCEGWYIGLRGVASTSGEVGRGSSHSIVVTELSEFLDDLKTGSYASLR